MSDTPHNSAETEKGFGTGLRAQLQRRLTEGGEPDGMVQAQGEQPAGELVEEVALPLDGAEVSARRAELEAARLREEALRLRLASHTEAFDSGISEHELVRRAATLDERE